MSTSSTPAKEGSSASTCSTVSPTVISEVHPDLVTFSRPFSRFNILPVGGRSTAVRLREPPNEGSLWVLASTPLDEVTKTKIKDLGGDVKYLVAADYVHHLYMSEWSKAYPDAKCIGVEGLDTKRKDVNWSGLYGVDDEASTKYGYENELYTRYWPTFSNKDLTFFHKSSQSLITADLIFNLPANEQYTNTPKKRATSPIPFLTSFMKYLAPTTSFHSWFLNSAGGLNPIPKTAIGANQLSTPGGSTTERRARFAKDAETVAAYGEMKRIIPCHGDIFDKGDVRQAFIRTFEKYLTPDGKSKFQSSQGEGQ
ncbi:unnamed protein product [Sympodiomycopsis kandeliae]